MRVLIVDDDPELAELVSRSLAREGHAVATAADLESARAALVEAFDVVILDLGLPDGSGLELCRELRAAGASVPILLLTAQSAVGERVAGLNAGADDYVVKPFALAELRARVRALGRRRESAPSVTYRTGDLEIDLSARRARRLGLEVELTPREWVVLECLAGSRGRVVSRDRLLEEGWGESSEAASASLEVLVGRIRRKLGRDAIRTVRGQGYAID
ncbi:MAG: response regulator transcription factor [Sandaracinaceae bacterium]|nr:response regulator transcription factor [Sandaracinaceae bacterium]